MNKILENLRKLKDVYYDTENFKLGEELFGKVKLLSSQEEAEVHSYAMKFDQGVAYFFAVKRETITRALINLNGDDVPEFIEELDDKNEKEKIERHVWLRKNVIKGWGQVVIDEIWKSYEILLNRTSAKIKSELKVESKAVEKDNG